MGRLESASAQTGRLHWGVSGGTGGDRGEGTGGDRSFPKPIGSKQSWKKRFFRRRVVSHSQQSKLTLSHAVGVAPAASKSSENGSFRRAPLETELLTCFWSKRAVFGQGVEMDYIALRQTHTHAKALVDFVSRWMACPVECQPECPARVPEVALHGQSLVRREGAAYSDLRHEKANAVDHWRDSALGLG
jgi:hypothetical protein